MNLATLEPDLVAFIGALPVASRLRVVEPLPESDIETLVKRFGRDAPAVYVSAGRMRVLDDHTATYTAALMLVARNASSYAGPRAHDARHGEAKGAAGAIGLYEILAHLVPHLHLADIGGAEWRVLDGGELLDFPAAWRQGLFATVLRLESGPVTIEAATDTDSLDDFITFDADYDLAGTDDTAEASDTVTLPQEDDA